MWSLHHGLPTWSDNTGGVILVESYNILIAGVGGQGNIVCGRSIALAAFRNGKRPVLGDTFGASRRGGSVLTHLRISDIDLGPLIPRGNADLIIGMEPLECLRAAVQYGSKRTQAVFSMEPIHSPATSSKEHTYPEIETIATSLEDICGEVYAIDTTPFLDQIGTHRVLNVYMLGALAGLDRLPLSVEDIQHGIMQIVGLTGPNRVAFDAGLKMGRNLSRGTA